MKFFGDVLTMGVLRDPVTAITSGIGLGANVLGGIFGAKTAEEAAEEQAAAARAAGKKVEGAAADTREAVLEAAKNAGGAVTTVADRAAAGVTSSADRSNVLLDPYRVAGEEATEELRRNLVTGGDFNKTPTMADLKFDPGIDYRIAEFQKALERKGAAGGVSQSGGFFVDLNRRVQGEASKEYQNAFDRYRQSTSDRFARLSGVSGMGKDAASEEGSNLRGSALYGGNAMTDATKFAAGVDIDANRDVAERENEAARIAAGYDTDAASAIAAGKVARTNAITGAITGGADAVTGALQFRQVLKNPTSKYVPSPFIPQPSPIPMTTAAPFVPAYPNRLRAS